MSLTEVERDFRTMKTGLLELRPIFLRKAERTEGHALVTMLALKLASGLTRRGRCGSALRSSAGLALAVGRRESALQYFRTFADREPARSARQPPEGTSGRARRPQVAREMKRESRSAVVGAVLLAAVFVRAGAKVFCARVPGPKAERKSGLPLRATRFANRIGSSTTKSFASKSACTPTWRFSKSTRRFPGSRWGSPATMRLFQTSADRSMSGTGSAEDFVAHFGAGYIAAIRQDLQSTVREGIRVQQRTDAVIFGLKQTASNPERERLSRIEEHH